MVSQNGTNGNGEGKYVTTATECSCPDFFYRGRKIAGHRCKHMEALFPQKPEPADLLDGRQWSVEETNEFFFGG